MKQIKRNFFSALILSIFALTSYSEGTKQFAPNTISLNSGRRDTVAMLNINGFGNGVGYPGATDKNRIYFNICDVNERVSIGLGRYYYTIPTNNSPTKQKLYYKIYNPAGVLVKVDSVGTGARKENLPTYSQVLNGPKIAGIGTGYDTTGWIFTPKTTGEHYIVFMDNLNDVSKANLPTYFYISHFDLTVFKKDGNRGIEYSGRLFSKAWALRTEAMGYPTSTGIASSFQRPFAGKVYVLSKKNNFVTSVDFKGSGFRGLGFVLAFNETGLYNTGNIGADRRSLQNIEAVNPDYKVFVNLPDQNCYPPNLNIPAIVNAPKLMYNGDCGDTTNLCLRTTVRGQGNLTVLLDFHNADGIFTPNTADVMYNLALGTSQNSVDTLCIPYNGRNGLGVQQTINQLEAVNIKASYSSGVTHFTMYDVEYLSVGYIVKSEVPALYTSVMRYNDTLIPDASGTGQPKYQVNGAPQPTHSWTNFDYGDQNTINSWWEAYSDTTVRLVNDLDTTNITPDIYQVNQSATPNDTSFLTAPFNTQKTICLGVNDVNAFDSIFYYYNVVKDPSFGTLSVDIITNDSCSIYTPNNNYIGFDTLIVSSCDDAPCQLCDSIVIIIEITTPLISYDSVTYGDTLTHCISLTSLSGNTYTSSICDTNVKGYVSLINDSCFQYVSNNLGTDSVCILICDEFNECVKTIVYIESLNDKPVASNDTVNTNEDVPVTFNVLTNDFDLSGILNPNTINIVSAPANGLLTIDTSLSAITYTPNPYFYGSDSFTYAICDTGLPVLCDTALVYITVAPINNKPVANNDYDTVQEDDTIVINILINDNDSLDNANVDYKTVSVIGGSKKGMTKLDSSSGKLTYIPDSNYFGYDTIIYMVCDSGVPLPRLCDTAFVFIYISPVNDAPVALDDYTAVNPFDSITFPVLVNDYDVETPTSDLVLSICGTGNLGAIVTVVGDSIRYYMPVAQPTIMDTICYTICDTNTPVLCDTALLIVTLPSMNLAPLATSDYVETNEDESITYNVLSNDIDPNLDAIVLTSIVQNPTNGIVSFNGNGDINYTPNPNFYGYDTLIYEVCDTVTPSLCDTSILVFNILPINDKPVANDDPVSTNENTIVSIDILKNDNDSLDNLPLDSLTITFIVPPINGTVAIDTSTKEVIYTPNSNFYGNDTIVYEICDQGFPLPRKCDTATIFITINPINNKPVASNDSITTLEDVPVSISVLFNDNDSLDFVSLDTSSVQIITNGGNGVGVVNPTTGEIIYTPNANFNGIDSIIYRVCDNGVPLPALCDTALVYIIINPVNDKPIANNDSIYLLEESTVNVNVMANDNDSLDGLALDTTSILVIQQPKNGVAIVDSTDIIYTPNKDFFGLDSLIYEICDTGTPKPIKCDTATVYFFISNTPDKDTLVIRANPQDPNLQVCLDTLDGLGIIDTATDCAGFAIGTTTNNGTNYTIDSIGCITFDFSTAITNGDTLCFIICDTALICDTTIIHLYLDTIPYTDTITISANPNDTVFFCLDTLDAISNFDSVSTCSGLLSDVGVNTNVSYTIDSNGCILFDFNNSNERTSDTLCFIVCDTNLLCDTTRIVVSVNDFNVKPITSNDTTSTNEDVSIIINVLINDNDSLDGLGTPLDTLSVNIIDQPTNGIAGVDTNGNIIYTPNTNFYGVDSLTYAVCDTGLPVLCDTAKVIIYVNPVNDKPIANNDSATTIYNGAITIDPLANDNDSADSGFLDSTSVIIVTGPTGGTASVDSVTGIITYTPNGHTGLDSIIYAVCDTGYPQPPLCDTATIYITVGNPTTTDTINITGNVNDTVLICLDTTDQLANVDSVSSCDGSTTGNLANSNASYSIDSIGCVTIDFTGALEGTDTLCVVICDSLGLCDTTIVIIETVDSSKPFIACQSINVYLDANGLGVIDSAAFIDSVYALAIDSIWLSNDTVSCVFDSILVTAYVRDTAGNIDSCSSFVYILDTLAPTPICTNVTLYLDSNLQAQLIATTLDNGSTDNCGISSISISQSSFSCNDIGINNVSLIIRDLAGNTDSCIAQVTVIDTSSIRVTCTNAADSLTGNGFCEYTIPDYSSALTVFATCSNYQIVQTPAVGTVIQTNQEDTIIYLVVRDSNTIYDSCSVTITLTCDSVANCYEDMIIPNGFSPNNDGLNDFFVIPGLGDCLENKLTIHNRWGDRVYEAENYQNNWDGSTNVSGLHYDGRILPTGTYFYIIKFTEPVDNSEIIRKGYIYISR